MASKGDILLKYKKAYPEFESQSINRLNELKRSFDNEKTAYIHDLDNLTNQLKINQNNFYHEINTLYQENQKKQNEINDKYDDISRAFNHEMKQAFHRLNEQTKEERERYEQILESFETRRQDALNIYLDLTKENNAKIDKDMKVHKHFIESEHQKLLAFKTEYDDLSAKVSNKMIWTIETSKNAINQLQNDLSSIDKNDLITLNQKILQSLSDLRGTRNDINVLFKETSSFLNEYRNNIYAIRKTKQKPYTEINHKLIHKLIKQIRLANENKNKYQSIIKRDLEASKKQLYPRILKAYLDHRSDDLEKYILQLEILEDKANYLINKISKITHYNVSTYQKRIKEIKVEAFTRNEEIKFSYSVPMKYIENAINIYSNYNFYFNQGFNDLDTLLSELINFSQSFNEIRDNEIINIRKDLADYQNNFLATITKASEKLSDLLYHIDEIANQIVTLESNSRLEIAEIKKEILNIDIIGDYKKYLTSLNTDYQLANRQYKNRIKKINIKKLYKDKIIEFYQTATNLEKEKESVVLHQAYNHELNQKELQTHLDYYDYVLSQMDQFYTHQTNLMDIFMKIMKERMVQSVKGANYHMARAYLMDETDVNALLEERKSILIQYINDIEKKINTNADQTQDFIDYLSENAKPYSLLTFIEKTRLNMHQQLSLNYSKKTKHINQEILMSYQEKHQLYTSVQEDLSHLLENKKRQLYYLKNNPNDLKEIVDRQSEYRIILLSLTAIHYDLLNYAYASHSPETVERMNNIYDDNLYKLTEKSIKTLDRLSNTKKHKKHQKILLKYLVFMIEALENIQRTYLQIIDQVHDQLLDELTSQIAVIKIQSDEEKDIIDQSFNDLDNKALKRHTNYLSHQSLMKKQMEDFNQWMTDKVVSSGKSLIKDQMEKEQSLKYLKKHVSKMILKNDKKLKKQLKLTHKDALNQYKQLMVDYHDDKTYLSILKDKIKLDASVENQYIDYITDQRIKRIKQTKSILERQLDTLPIERRTRLMNVDIQYKALFSNHQDMLYQKLRLIERDKFVKVPLLEKKISEKEDQVQIDFQTLYNKHKELEDHYLNQYTQINQNFTDLHNHFKEDTIKSNLGYDQALNQPLKDLLKVQASIIDKTNIIHQEVSNKTQAQITEIHKDNEISQEKQARIINS
jgi:hypothetical protein